MLGVSMVANHQKMLLNIVMVICCLDKINGDVLLPQQTRTS